jgi:hypothetical protein
MKTILILTLSLSLTACSVAFKTGSSNESSPTVKKSDQADAQSAMTGKTGGELESEQTGLTGTYRYKSGNANNAIGIEELGGNRLRVYIVANYEYKDSSDEWMANTGTATEVVTKNGDAAVFVPKGYEADCEIRLRFSGGKIIVKQKGVGGDCGFGGNVTAEGTYTKTSDKLNQNEMIDELPEKADGVKTKTDGVRIQFKAGASSAIVSGTAVSGEEKTYVVGARAGQTMTVKITENSPYNDVVFHIVAPNGSFPMGTEGEGVDEQAEIGTEWSGKLPTSGDYKIVIGTIESKKANFKMSVAIR